MHYNLTWGTFALILAAVLLIYYLVLLFTYYRKEMAAFFEPKLQAVKAGPDGHVMGIVHEDEAEMRLVGSEELDFAGPDKAVVLGGLADFMQELKTLIRITIEAEDSKDNFLSLFRLVAAKYAPLLDGYFNQSIINYVLDSDLPFTLSPNELAKNLNDLNDE